MVDACAARGGRLDLGAICLPRGMGQRNEKTRGGVGQREQGAGANRGDPCLGARNGRLFEDSKTPLRDPYPAEKRRSPTKEAYTHPSPLIASLDEVLVASTQADPSCTFFPWLAVPLGRLPARCVRPLVISTDERHQRLRRPPLRRKFVDCTGFGINPASRRTRETSP